MKLLDLPAFRLPCLSPAVGGMLLLLAAGCDQRSVLGTRGPPNVLERQILTLVPTTVQLVPSSDVLRQNVIGVGNPSLLYTDLADGTSFALADDNTTYVRSENSFTTGTYTAGFSGAPAGAVSSVVVNLRASLGTASTGSAQVLLYDGSSLIGTGPVHALGAFTNFSDDFPGLSAVSANLLRVSVALNNPSATGAVRATELWISVTQASAPSDGGTNTCGPVTCTVVGATCGAPPDGCGGQLNCGSCVSPQVCGGDFTCGNSPSSSHDPVVLVVGEIACAPGQATTALTCADANVARLAASHPHDALLLLGDAQNPSGARADYQARFDKSWGPLLPNARAVPGNHDYRTTGAADYFSYFGAAAGDPARGYYSFDLGAWHLVALNSSDHCRNIPCAAGSAQETWLKQDLMQHTNACTLAFWHQPRFSSGDTGSELSVAPFWVDLYAANAELILNAHDHDYERLAPLNPAGQVDGTRGLREFVVGTGGAGFGTFPFQLPNVSQARSNNTFGLLELTLHPTSYDWRFLGADGGTFQDQGFAYPCH